MNETEDECEQLLEEYQALRRRVEEVDFASPDYDAGEDSGVSEDEIERLRDLKDRLETECDVEMPDEQEDDLDLPDYAGTAPSEPRDYEEGDTEQ